jgi:hypothetical protein
MARACAYSINFFMAVSVDIAQHIVFGQNVVPFKFLRKGLCRCFRSDQ